MRRLRFIGALLALAQFCGAPAYAGTLGLRTAFKGSPASADAASVAVSRDLVILGDGTGPSKAKAIRAANPNVALGLYVKCGGVRPSDAEWTAAQPYLWRDASGTVYTQGQNGWSYADLQRFANLWAETVVVPHIAATLAGVPAGTYDTILVDNAVQQHPSLFVPKAPPDYSQRTYHDSTLVVLRRVRAAFPGLRLLANGWQGWADAGVRGEALGASDPETGLPWADGVWFEGVVASMSGKAPTAARYQQDLGAYLGLASAGKLVVWDEGGVSGWRWREAAGQMIAATGYGARTLGDAVAANAYLIVAGPPFEGWTR